MVALAGYLLSFKEALVPLAVLLCLVDYEPGAIVQEKARSEMERGGRARLASQRRGIYPDGRSALAAMGRREVRSRDIVDACLEAIDADNGRVNAVICLDAENARTAADSADKAAGRGDRLGPLHGLPVTIKDSFDLSGLPTTFGYPAFAKNVQKSSAVVADRLTKAGAIILGKTNTPEGLRDWETNNPLFGPTRNPYDLERSAGGSSGGSAAAVASGFSYLDIGSDGGGSIRLPAHYCGIYGLKPTSGVVSPRGHSLQKHLRAPDGMAVGPLARSARDAALALQVVAGPDEAEAVAWRLALPEPSIARLAGLKVAVLLDHPACSIDAEYGRALSAFVDALGRGGAKIDNRARPDVDLERVELMFNLLARAETSTGLDADQLAASQAIAASADTSISAYERINARGALLPHREWLLLHEERLAIGLAWRAFFSEYDVLVLPAAASAAPLLSRPGEVARRTIPINGGMLPVLAQHFWYAPASLCGLPSLVIPIGHLANRLPVGAQLVAARYRDRDLTRVGELVASQDLTEIG